MTATIPPGKRATLEELVERIERTDNERLEIVGGEIVEKATPSWQHSETGGKLGGILHPFNRRPGGPKGPGGWWIGPELHVVYPDGEIYCHDLAGFHRERMAGVVKDSWARIRPDWVCEIVSPSHEKRDHVIKPQTLYTTAVPHYWLVHPEQKILLVHRWSADGYIVVLRATSGEVVRAEPFQEIEINVGELFGDDD